MAVPALLRMAGQAMLMPVQPTLQGVLDWRLNSRLHIAAGHSDRRGTREPGPFCRRLVGDQDGADLNVDAQMLSSAQIRWSSDSAAGTHGQCSTCSTSTTNKPGTLRPPRSMAWQPPRTKPCWLVKALV